jgi:hypothetical protein
MKRINTTAKPKQINEVVAFAHNGNTEIVETLDFRDGVRYALEFEKRKNRIASAPSLLKENQDIKETLNDTHKLIDEYKESLKCKSKENQELKADLLKEMKLSDKQSYELKDLKSINEELIKMLIHAVEWIEEMHGETHDSKIYKDLLSKAKPQTTPS